MARAGTGCITCRIRRVKCDNAVPSCKRCTSTGRKCDGYPVTPQSRNRMSSPTVLTSPPSTAKASHSTSLTTPSLDVKFFTSEKERRSFDFFQKCTIPQLSGLFDSAFWNRLVLQTTHHEPAIRHAAVALGALHECFEEPISNLNFDRQAQNFFAMQQYVKAIGLLVEPIKKRRQQAADVALMTCVLFVCFETLRGHHGAALSHIDGGVKIISELQPSSNPPSRSSSSIFTQSPIPYVDLKTFNIIFIRLDTQAATMAYDRGRQLLSSTLDDAASGYNTEIPLSFASLEEARNALDHIHTFGTRFLHSIYAKETRPPYREQVRLSLELLRGVCMTRLRQWSAAFEALVQSRGEEMGITLLRIHRLLMGINLSINHERALTDEMVWDEYTAQFEAIVSHAATVISHTTNSRTPRQASFSLDTGIIFPLYFVAAKCRESRIRRSAIQLLKASERQEGVWNSLLTARVAERVVSIEEEGKFLKASEVLRVNRIAGVEAKLEMEEKRARLRYCKIGGKGETREVVEEMVEW